MQRVLQLYAARELKRPPPGVAVDLEARSCVRASGLACVSSRNDRQGFSPGIDRSSRQDSIGHLDRSSGEVVTRLLDVSYREVSVGLDRSCREVSKAPGWPLFRWRVSCPRPGCGGEVTTLLTVAASLLCATHLRSPSVSTRGGMPRVPLTFQRRPTHSLGEPLNALDSLNPRTALRLRQCAESGACCC